MKDGYSAHTYGDIIKEFGEQKVKERFLFLFSMAHEYLKTHYQRFLNTQDYFYISKRIIGEIVLNYFTDVIRLKAFHKINNIEFQKVAAYSAYWVARCKPIQIVKEIPQEIANKNKGIYFTNESFACNLLIAMRYNTTQPLLRDTGELNKFTHTLHYHLSYRLTSPQMLELSLLALDSNPIYAPLEKPKED